MLRFSSEPAYPSKLLSLEFTQSIRARILGWFRTDSGTSYRLSKSRPPCPAERHFYSPRSISIPSSLVNTVLTFSTAFLSSQKLIQCHRIQPPKEECFQPHIAPRG
jgi:hypothetical protein